MWWTLIKVGDLVFVNSIRDDLHAYVHTDKQLKFLVLVVSKEDACIRGYVLGVVDLKAQDGKIHKSKQLSERVYTFMRGLWSFDSA